LPALVISRPPHQVAEVLACLALDGGCDGLDAHRRLARILPRRLTDEGIAVVEHGDDQGLAAERIYAQAGLVLHKCHADLGGRRRCLVMARHGDKKTVGKVQGTV
jgi:release factor glutamine methyltransferase